MAEPVGNYPPKTELERQATHQAIYGTTALPPRGTRLRRQREKPRYKYEAGWVYEDIGKNFWKIYPTGTYHSVTMTGSDVTKQLPVDSSHRLIRMTFFHSTSTYGRSTDNLLLRIERPAGTLTPLKFVEYLFEEDLLTDAEITLIFGETYEYEATIWKFTFNTTSGDLIFPVIYIQKIEQSRGD